MKYNFDEIVDRSGTFASKVERLPKGAPADSLALWVADMDFPCAEPIIRALHERIDRKIFGYTMDYDPEYYQAMDQWCRERYDWSFPKEQLCYSPGIVPALFRLTGHLVREDEKVLIVTPSYGPFRGATKFNHCGLVCSSLKYDGGDFYFDGSAGLLLCADCAARQNKTPNLDPAALLALRHIALVEDKKIFSFSIPPKSMEALGRVTERYALQVLDKPLKTLDFVHTMLS